jgi:hypothetical protein
MKKIILTSIFCVLLFSTYAQKNLSVQIHSENKIIWKEESVLDDILKSAYRQEILDIENRLLEIFKDKFKQLTGRSTRAEYITIGRTPIFTVESDGDQTWINTLVYFNSAGLRVTTPDVAFGIGVDREADPTIGVEFSISGATPVFQDKTLSSIRFLSTQWNIEFKLTSYSGDKLTFKGALEKPEIEQWLKYSLPRDFTALFYTVNFEQTLNDYLGEKIKNNKQLRLENDIDNDENLKVSKQAENELVFRHLYTSTGISKRSAKQDASVVIEEHKYTPVVTETQKPVEANKVITTSTAPAKPIPTTSTPDPNKGPSSTKYPPKTTTSPGGIISSPKIPKKNW